MNMPIDAGENCRISLADLIGLALRERADIMSGDFNQAGSYLEECVYWAVKYYAEEHGLPAATISWTIPEPDYEIRTVLFNWPIDGEKHRMFYREQRTFRDLSVEDVGLRPTDTDTHVPPFMILTRSKENPIEGPAFREIFRTRSEAGKALDKARNHNTNGPKDRQ